MAEVEDFPGRAADAAADLTEAKRAEDRRTRITAFVKNTAVSGAGVTGRGARAAAGPSGRSG